MHRIRKNRGFTLIEIMIVILIIGILAAIMLPNLIYSRYQANLASAEHSIRALATAMESYRTAENSYPPGGILDTAHILFTTDYVNPGDLTDPSNGSRFELLVNDEVYTIVSHGIHHLVIAGVDENYPQYAAGSGISRHP